MTDAEKALDAHRAKLAGHNVKAEGEHYVLFRAYSADQPAGFMNRTLKKKYRRRG